MSLKIRLQRAGKSIKRRHHFKIVVIERSRKRDGKFVDSLGYYDPSQNPVLLKVDVDKYQDWVKKGAEPSETVASLFRNYQRKNKKEEK